MLRDLLQSEPQLIVPGSYDALSAHCAGRAGFKAIYMSGFGVAGSLLARPDIGLVSATEMMERARQIVAAAAGTPVIADGDNGYGGEYNVARLVQAYEQAGVQCIQLEDQLSPKRCGHMDDKQVCPLEEAVSKIRMALASRRSEDFLIMARTDARAPCGLDEALHRGEAFLEAGADLLFIEAPQSIAEMEAIGERFAGTPLVANMVEDGKTPLLSYPQLLDLGFQVVLRPISALLAVARTLEQSYAALAAGVESEAAPPRLSFQAYNELLGLANYR